MNLWNISYQYWNIVFASQKLISSPDFNPSKIVGKPSITLMNDRDIKDCFAELVSGHDVLVECHNSLRDIVSYCKKHYIFVKAAGGVVEEPSGKRLLIYRNDRWDLPKGKVEEGETLKKAALREVNEESGMRELSAGALLTKTYHIFNLYGGWHLKQTSWYKMSVPTQENIVVQQEEGITKGEWVEPEEYNSRLSNSYATLRKVRY